MITSVDVVKLHNAFKREGMIGKPSMAIAGFSVNGMQAGMLAKKAGFKVVAVSDESCGIVDIGGNGGLDINRLIRLKKKKSFYNIELKNTRKTKPDFLPKIEVDVLIVETLEKGLAEEVRARVVLGYGTISKEASEVLRTKQIPLIPLEY